MTEAERLATQKTKWSSADCMDAAAELRRLAAVESELEALKASIGEPVAWINKDHTYVELSTPSTVYGSHTIPLYALTNKETK